MDFGKEKVTCMRIVIDARLWSESGLGRYIRNLVAELQRIDKTNNYYILHLVKDFDSIAYTNKNFHKVFADFKWYGVDEQIKLPKLIRNLNPDLVHFPHFNVPVFYKGKFVVTIHDLIHQHFATRDSSTLNPILHTVKKIGYKKVFSFAVKNSAKIIVPSKFVKNQLITEWRIKEDKIAVTYEGVDKKIIKIIEETEKKFFLNVTEKFKIKKPFLFYLGNAQPHKNIYKLIEAFVFLKEKYPKLSLVLSGPEHFFWEKIKKKSHIGGLSAGKAGVIFTGFISDKEMVALYQNAEAFIMPSLEEGFGLPVLEAMMCNCPVISSNEGSLPEIAKDAALYFDPRDENDMAEKITQILENKKLRKNLIEKGAKRYKEFSWEEMAMETLKIYNSL